MKLLRLRQYCLRLSRTNLPGRTPASRAQRRGQEHIQSRKNCQESSAGVMHVRQIKTALLVADLIKSMFYSPLPLGCGPSRSDEYTVVTQPSAFCRTDERIVERAEFRSCLEPESLLGSGAFCSTTVENPTIGRLLRSGCSVMPFFA
jgi:hypothetical protein